MRKKLIAGNWKMFKTPGEAVAFINTVKSNFDSYKSDVVLCVPYVSLQPVMAALDGTHIKVGAQNVHEQDKGAYTGEISAPMLANMKVPYVIIGHSERRQYYNETDESVNKKIIKALEYNIIPILCVGENLTQRDTGVTNALLDGQVRAAFAGISANEACGVVIAYEPIWAIGTGRTATPEQAQDACAYIRQVLTDLYGGETAQCIRILYGGSVKPDNARILFTQNDIDGGLVGGASLEESFKEIVHFE